MSTTVSAQSGAHPHPTLRGTASTLLEEHDVLLLDLDGVVYVGPHAVPHAPQALQAAVAAGHRLGFITNNASRTPATVAAHLRDLDVPAADEDVVNSAQAAADHLAGRFTPGAPVLLVGGTGLRVALDEVGLRATDDRHEAVAVVQGFSPDLGWAQLAEATHAVRSGLPWIATNLDATVPTPGGPAPGNGLLVDLVARAAGRRPDVVCGKPERALFDAAVARLGAQRAVVVGDRLDTDLQGARTAGLAGLLVLTGVTGVVELLAAAPHERPSQVGHDLRSLTDVHPAVQTTVQDGTTTGRCRSARVQVGTDGLRVLDGAAGPDGLDVLRAAAAAVWAATDSGLTVDLTGGVAAVAATVATPS
ncbi:HAD-IIA family hydrolase [Kineococcus sp. SYSU DK003]|uniref:HAD-IIA family hydrolase n=1 Tax=Kineococcus sp. SYSU DK003 TaxID=3383124 RepID=UPI003D7CDE0B